MISSSFFFFLSAKSNSLKIDTYIHLLIYICLYVWIYWACRDVGIVGIILFFKERTLIGHRVVNDSERFNYLIFT